MSAPIVTINERNQALLGVIVSDPIIKNTVAVIDGSTAAVVEVQNDGSVKIYPSKKWWSKLVGDNKTISFDELCLQIIDALSGHATAKNKTVLDGLMAHFTDYRLNKSISADAMIDMLFLVYFINFDGKTKNLMENGFNPFPEATTCEMHVNLGGQTVAMPFIIKQK